MLTFLAPSALFGMLLLAIPVIVHLFRPRKMRQTPFSSLRWLRLTKQRLSRRIQWHQVLLFLLRAGFIVLLVLALAQPLAAPKASGRLVERFVVLDVSRSMGYRTTGRATPLERAKQVAAEIVNRARTGDRTALLLTGSSTRILTPLNFDARSHLATLGTTRAGATDTNLGSALAVIRPLLDHCRPDTDVEVYLLTDNHQGSWNQGAIAAFRKDLPMPVRVRVVNVGLTAAPNAWIADARLVQRTDPDRRVLRVEVGCVGDTTQQRTISVTGLPGTPERTHSLLIEPGQPVAVALEIPAELKLRGQVATVRLEPPDALPGDDVFFVNLDPPAALRVLLVEPGRGSDERRPALHLRTAIEALARTTNQALQLERRPAESVRPRDLEQADVVFLAGVAQLADNAVEALQRRVRAGGGLAVFLGPSVKPEFYNRKLFKKDGSGLLPLSLAALGGPRPGRDSLAPLTGIRWSHPLLAPLNDPVLGALGRTRFRSFYRFGGSPVEGSTVLAWIDGEVPALVEHRFGSGKVLLFNATAGDDWSDLPRRKSYVPLVDRLLSYLSAGGVRRTFEAGAVVTLPLANWRPGETVQVRTPTGDTVTPRLFSAGGRMLLRLETVEAGIYRVEREGGNAKGFPVAVNVGRGDSVLTPMDDATLAKWWAPLDFETLNPETATRHLTPAGSPLSLWPWLLAAGGLLLLLEMFFVHRLCPRTNPALATAVVHKRGLLRI